MLAMVFASYCGGTVKMQDHSKPDEATDDGIAWTRRDIPQAGISIPQHPDWASLDNILADRGVVYQRFGAANGMVFVSYGPDATVDWQLAHTGVDPLTTCTVEVDERIDFLGTSARRIHLRLHHARGSSHRRGPTGPEALPASEDEILVFVGFTRGSGPVLVGYRVAQSEMAAFESLLERVLHGVRPV
jgi:hypothetical protein